jgi:hypothetical protein
MRNRQKLKTAKNIKRDVKDIFEIERRKFFELDKKEAQLKKLNRKTA